MLANIINLISQQNTPKPKKGACVIEVHDSFQRDAILILAKIGGLSISQQALNTKPGELLCFGFNSFADGDFDVTNAANQTELKTMFIQAVGIKNYTNSNDPKKSAELLTNYVKQNTSKEDDTIVIEIERSIPVTQVFVISVEKPKKEVVKVHENIVRIGYSIYSIQEDVFGDEFIIANGKIRKVVRSIFGDRLE